MFNFVAMIILCCHFCCHLMTWWSNVPSSNHHSQYSIYMLHEYNQMENMTIDRKKFIVIILLNSCKWQILVAKIGCKW
jgi:hypothetical protein